MVRNVAADAARVDVLVGPGELALPGDDEVLPIAAGDRGIGLG